MVDLMYLKFIWQLESLYYDYDYEKYGGRVNVKLETFTRRHDRYFFHKASKRYNDRVVDYFVSNFIDDRKWIGNLINNNEGTENC